MEPVRGNLVEHISRSCNHSCTAPCTMHGKVDLPTNAVNTMVAATCTSNAHQPSVRTCRSAGTAHKVTCKMHCQVNEKMLPSRLSQPPAAAMHISTMSKPAVSQYSHLHQQCTPARYPNLQSHLLQPAALCTAKLYNTRAAIAFETAMCFINVGLHIL